MCLFMFHTLPLTHLFLFLMLCLLYNHHLYFLSFYFITTISSTTPLALLLPPSASGDTEKGNCSLCRAHVRSCSSAVFCNRCVRAPALVCDHICHFRLQISGFASPRVTVALYKSAGPTTESLNHWCQIVSEPDWPRAVSY